MVPCVKSFEVTGLRVDALGYGRVVDHLDDWIVSGLRPARIIVQINAYSCVVGMDDVSYRSTVNAADLSVPDGMPIVWLGRLHGLQLTDRVYGPELLLRLAARGAKHRWKVYLYGGAPGIAEDLAARLERDFPGLSVVGWDSPPFRDLSPEEDAFICDRINAVRPDVVWVSLGGPKQDKWAMEHKERLDTSVIHGVGAAFDFLTERVRQAPGWMQASGLEWAYRLYREPRRLWRRYLIGNARFIYHAVPELIRHRIPWGSAQ